LHFRWSGSATPTGHPAALPDQRKYAGAAKPPRTPTSAAWI